MPAVPRDPWADPLFGPQQPIFPQQGPQIGMPQQQPIDPFAENIQQGVNFGPLRQPNIFPPPGTPDYDADARMAQLYQPETEMQDKYIKLLESRPVRPEKTSKWRKLGASMIALKNPELAHHALNAPYEHAMKEWESQMQPAQFGLSQERQSNINARQLANATVGRELEMKKIDIAQQKADIAERRAEIYALKSQRKNIEFDYRGPKVIASDHDTGETWITNTPTGAMSMNDRILLEHKGEMQEIGARTAGQLKVAESNQQSREAVAETRGWNLGKDEETGKSILYNEITGETKPIGAGKITPMPRPGAAGREESKSQKKIGEYIAARHLKNTRPDLAPYIQLGPKVNEFKVQPPGFGGRGGILGIGAKEGASQESIDEINRFIYGAGGQATQPVRSTAGPVKTAPVQTTGKVKVRNPEGQEGTIPAANLERALAKGYTLVTP